MPATGIALLQMGGPETPEALPPFLRRLFTDPEMIRLPSWLEPLQTPLGALYGTLRAGRVREDYEAIGFSDLNPTTRSLAESVDDRLGDAVVGVEPAMRYTEPRATTALDRLTEAGAERVLAVTLYPFFSLSTTGSSLVDLENARDEHAPELDLDAVDRWGSEEAYLDATADWTRETIREHAGEGSRAVLLSAHGIPKPYLEEGDPYKDEVTEAAKALGKRLPDERVELAFQSDIGPVEWLDPSTEDAIRALADEGVDELVIVPFGFVSEHIETLFEIDVEYRELAHEAGIEHVHRVPAFDDAPVFAEIVADLARREVEAAS